ncbi:MAG TPA: undecaprenyldiphospho-muramoylpentapeptide beta-N-acetylglucosaminyltransferase [Actinomycetota bacterium]|nr:undecaprenyldiphospho-muramoylpentapeptide beta-N-acetylglucosaminyltransferase [Actinomycetota bacterium]
MKVVVAGGGTGGHVTPALAVARRLIDDHGATVRFIGSSTGFEATMVPEAGIEFHGIEVVPLYREVSFRAARAPFVAARSVGRARALIRGADVVLGVGGYASVPAGIAARRERIPLVLHEQNAVPSLSNRVLARWATAIGSTFASAASRFGRTVRVEHTGNPVRSSILAVPTRRDELATQAREAFRLEADRRTVLVTGGSQGALHLDQVIAAALPALAPRPVQLVVVTGRDHVAVVADAVERGPSPRVHVAPFLDRIELAYAVADVAVARAGAGSVAELAVCGIPCVLVPYPHATANHQEANARELVAAGGAEMIVDRELSPDALVACILGVMDDDARRRSMAQAMRSWARPDADVRLAELVMAVAR